MLIMLAFMVSCQNVNEVNIGTETGQQKWCYLEFVSVKDGEHLDVPTITSSADLLQCIKELCCIMSYDTITPFLKFEVTEKLIEITEGYPDQRLYEFDQKMKCTIGSDFLKFLQKPVPDIGNEGIVVARKNEERAYELLWRLRLIGEDHSSSDFDHLKSKQELKHWITEAGCD